MQAGFFELADRKLAWIDRRQELLAQDIANADTPGWRTHDLKPFASLLDDMPLTALRTDPAHITATSRSSTETKQRDGERAPDGNAVSLDAVLTRIAETDASHELVSDLYKKYLGLFRLALGR